MLMGLYGDWLQPQPTIGGTEVSNSIFQPWKLVLDPTINTKSKFLIALTEVINVLLLGFIDGNTVSLILKHFNE